MHKRILVATDGSSYSAVALKEALNLAKACKCPLIIVSAVMVTDEFEALAPNIEEMLIKEAQKTLNAAAKRAERAGLSVETVLRTGGEPYEVICEVAREKKVDLIVLGSHGRTGLKRLLMGSVAERVIGHAHCSVLVVKA